MKELLQSADPQVIAKILSEGGIVIFPTDTVWGIGCVYDNPDSISRLYKIKNRQPDKPTSLLLPNKSWLRRLAKVKPDQVKIINKFWPGALTVVLPADSSISNLNFLSEKNEVGLRIPNHKMLLKVLSILKKPILGPSANFASLPPPRKLTDLDPELLNKVDAVFLGGDGQGTESTIVSLSSDKPVIIRSGAVKI